MTRSSHPVFARGYAWLNRVGEDRGLAEHRRELLRGLEGRVLEIGAGDGASFRHYPSAVTEVLAVEPEPYLRARAEDAARGAPVPVRVVDGVAERLPVEDGTFDAAVASLVLCSVADPDRALAELHRAVRSGGELRLYEHVRADGPLGRRLQRLVDPLWSRLAGGCHTSRDTPAAAARAGFEPVAVRRFAFPSLPPSPASPHVLGRWRRVERAAQPSVAGGPGR